MSSSGQDDFAPYALDPFGPSANPAAYVASESSERARRILQAALDGGRAAAVVGAPGHGKTLLLHLIAGREQVTRARVAYVPFPSLAEAELFAMILEALGEKPESDPRAALREVVREQARRGGITLAIDDAHELQPAAARALAEEAAAAHGALRLLFAAMDGDRAYQVFQVFGKDIEVVSLDGRLSPEETRRYVETRLAYGGARPDLVAAFDEETLAELHRDSHGVPRELNRAAQRVVRRAEPGNLPRLREILRHAESEEEEDDVPYVSLASLAERVLAGDTPPQPPRRVRGAAEPAGAGRPLAPARSAEPPRSWESARSAEPPRSSEAARSAEPPRSWESARSAEPPRSSESARSAEPPRSSEPARSVERGREPDAARAAAALPASGPESTSRADAAATPAGPASPSASAARREANRLSLEPEHPLARGAGVRSSLIAPPPPAATQAAGAYRMARAHEEAARQAQARGGAATREPAPAPTAAPVRPPARSAPSPALDPTPAPGFERLSGRGGLRSRDTARLVFKWLAFGVGVSLSVMWWAGGDDAALSRSPALPPEGARTGLVPAEEITQRGLPQVRPEQAPAPPAGLPATEFLAPQARPATPPAEAAEAADAAEVLEEVPLGEPASPDPATPAPGQAAAPAAEPAAEPAPALAEGDRIGVSINATPWARIEIDGVMVGETPLAGVLLEPGPHHFRALMPDGTEREAHVDVSPDRRALSFE